MVYFVDTSNFLLDILNFRNHLKKLKQSNSWLSIYNSLSLNDVKFNLPWKDVWCLALFIHWYHQWNQYVNEFNVYTFTLIRVFLPFYDWIKLETTGVLSRAWVVWKLSFSRLVFFFGKTLMSRNNKTHPFLILVIEKEKRKRELWCNAILCGRKSLSRYILGLSFLL